MLTKDDLGGKSLTEIMDRPVECLFARRVREELQAARLKNAPMNSAHEAYAVILEELDELWEEVRKKRSERNPAAMAAELVQIAAMCQRAAEDLRFVERQ